MCSTTCNLCHGWDNKCPGVHGVIEKLEDKIRLKEKQIKWMRERLRGEYEVTLRGKDASNWKISRVDK